MYQGGGGLIQSIEIGNKSGGDNFAMRVYLHAVYDINHIRIDWRLSDGSYYPSTYVRPGSYSNYMDVPTFSTNEFTLSVEYRNFNYEAGSIYKSEIRRYIVRGI